MGCKIIETEAHNRPELMKLINEKFSVVSIRKLDRKFLRFEGVNFVYHYKVKVVVRNQMPICDRCDKPITTKIAYKNCQKLCITCYDKLMGKKPNY